MTADDCKSKCTLFLIAVCVYYDKHAFTMTIFLLYKNNKKPWFWCYGVCY